MMDAWDYSNPDVLELRYEEILGNEEFWFSRLFNWYRFRKSGIEQGVKIARRFSLQDLKSGDPGFRHQNRRSKPGYWREYFTEPVSREFKHHYGHVLIKLGYETDLDW